MAATDLRGAAFRVALAVVSLAAAMGARADDRLGATVFVHTDDDGLTTIHPVATARVAVGDQTHVSARYDADVISAATVDVRTSASPRGFEETRHGAGLGVEHDLTRTLHARAGYGFSHSDDYITNAGSLGLSLEDDARNHTFGVGLGVARDAVGRTNDVRWIGHLTSIGGDLSWAALLGPTAISDLTFALEHERGFMENPYRYVPIRSPDRQSEVRVTEEVPDARVRVAGRARLRWSPLERLFLRATYRLHADDWGVAGHTVEVASALEPTDAWLVELHGRFYGQRGASFYRGSYQTLPGIPDLRTLDRELAPGYALSGGAVAQVRFLEWGGFQWHLDLRGDVTWHRYFDTPALPERLALTAGLGVFVER